MLFGLGAAMKSSQFLASILVLACVSATTDHANAGQHRTQFPAKGTPYAEARASLLKQGLTVTRDPEQASDAKVRMALRKRGISIPEKLPPLDPKFREIECGKLVGKSIYCRVLFLETDSRGWRNYVIVQVDPKDKTIVDTRYPSTVDSLPSIPPPSTPDLPQIKGSYFTARKTLQTLGFRPAHNHPRGALGGLCSDSQCNAEFAETSCSGTGMAFCIAYWISPHGRVLRVTTIGEHPKIYFVQWSTWKNLRTDFGK